MKTKRGKIMRRIYSWHKYIDHIRTMNPEMWRYRVNKISVLPTMTGYRKMLTLYTVSGIDSRSKA